MTLELASCTSGTPKTRRSASHSFHPGKRIPPQLWLDKTRIGQIFNSALGPWNDKYLGAYSFPKIWKNLELSKSTKRTSFLPFAGFCPGLCSFRFWPGWVGKRAPNDVQKVLLETLDLKLEGGHACRKSTHIFLKRTQRKDTPQFWLIPHSFFGAFPFLFFWFSRDLSKIDLL